MSQATRGQSLAQRIAADIKSLQAAVLAAVKVGGDLGGTAALPIVAKVNGVAVTGTPTADMVLTATGASAATWKAIPVQQGGGGGSGLIEIIETSSDHTVVASNNGKAIHTNSPAHRAIVLPAGLNGVAVEALRLGAGDLSWIPGPGASVITAEPGLSFRAVNSSGSARCFGNTWHVVGDMKTTVEALDPLEMAPAHNTPVITFGTLGSTAAPATGLGAWQREKRVGVAETTTTGGSTADLDLAESTRYRYYGFPSAPGTTIAAGAQAANYVETQLMPGAATQFAYYPFGYDFMCNGSIVQIRANATSATPFLGNVLVDGQLVTATQTLASGLTAGSGYHMTLTFPDARERRIQVMNMNRGQGRFGGVASNGSVWKPVTPVKKVVVIGDSYVGGAGTVGAADTFVKRLGLLLAGRQPGVAVHITTLGIGSTGPQAILAGEPTSNFAGRVAAAMAMSPDILIFVGLRNEGTNTTGLQAAVESLGNATNTVPERYWIPSASNSTQAAVRAAAAAGCAATGIRFVDANVDSIPKLDGTHFTQAGHDQFASEVWAQIGAFQQ